MTQKLVVSLDLHTIRSKKKKNTTKIQITVNNWSHLRSAAAICRILTLCPAAPAILRKIINTLLRDFNGSGHSTVTKRNYFVTYPFFNLLKIVLLVDDSSKYGLYLL